ncbi:MAG: 2-C-methyl-D-erythritol 2,4-cyclodiphosphate synthase [Gemmatimonadota bacterium]
MRVGIGYDSHRFDADRPLVLGGVEIPDVPGLAGHSDADAVAHAVIDAVLGAAGRGDIGQWFPADDPRWSGADSMALLRQVVGTVQADGLRVGNVDVTVVCEQPRLAPHVAGMRASLAAALDVALDAVSIKGKSNEGMGWIGRGEGVAVLAVALLVHPGD